MRLFCSNSPIMWCGCLLTFFVFFRKPLELRTQFSSPHLSPFPTPIPLPWCALLANCLPCASSENPFVLRPCDLLARELPLGVHFAFQALFSAVVLPCNTDVVICSSPCHTTRASLFSSPSFPCISGRHNLEPDNFTRD